MKLKVKIKHSPEVAPVVHGHFIHDGPRFTGGVDWWHCSNCGKLASGMEIFFDYCPFCGAKMDEKEDWQMTDIMAEIEMLMAEGYSEEDIMRCVEPLSCSDEEFANMYSNEEE